MRQLRIDTLALHNFKGIRNYEASFSPSGATVTGHNGTGKSTLADAFSWLIKGKDAAGNTEARFSIKTLDASGDYIPDLEHSVEAAFTLIDTETGETEKVRFRRSYVEEWKTEAGQDRKLDGHHVDYFVNDVPVTRAKYNERLTGLIPQNLLTLLTDPAAFFRMSWDAQRDTLVAMTGKIDAQEVATAREDFCQLLDRLNGDSLEDYRIKIGAKLKKVNARIAKIPTEIDATEAATPEAPDFAALEAKKEELDKRIEELDAAAYNIAERRRLQFEEAAKIRTEIGQLERERRDLLNREQTKLDQATNEKNRERRDVQNKIADIKDQISREQYAGGSIVTKRSQATDLRNDAARLDEEQAKRRKEFERVALQPYNPASLICPRFGHECQDPHACSQGEAAFNASKAETLERYRKKGHEVKATIEKQQARAQELEDEASRLEEVNTRKLDDLRTQLTEAEQRLATLPETPRRTLTLADLPDAAAYAQKLAALQAKAEQATAEGPTVAQFSNGEKGAVQAERDQILRKLGLRETIDRNNKTVRDLRGELANLTQAKADLGLLLKTADDFSQALTDAVEQKVNALFHGLKFRMWKQYINGKQEPDCVALIDGVNYPDANTAGKINAGLQVIRAISRHYGLAAPIFVDNCESIAELEATEGQQVIRLQFVNGAPLTVTPD